MVKRVTLIMVVFFLFLALVTSVSAHAAVLFQDNFDSYNDSPANHGWSTSKVSPTSNISMVDGQGVGGSRAVMITYDRPGTGPYWFGVNVGKFNRNAIFVRFYFRVDDPSGGSKFLKLFGKKDEPVGCANTTLMINYFHSDLYEISYGNGSGTANDTQTVIRYAGAHSDSDVQVPVAEGPFDPRDGQWHCYEFYMKYNDDNLRNGEYKVWIDGKLYVHATNVKNRNIKNSNEFASVQLANYCNNNWAHTWHLWYDNVVIADEYIEPIASATNKMPQSVQGFQIIK